MKVLNHFNLLHVCVILIALIDYNKKCYNYVTANEYTRDYYCPVSSIIDTKATSLYTYPMDLFDNQQYQQIILQSIENSDDIRMNSYNCSSKGDYDMTTGEAIHLRYCSNFTKCPLFKQNIFDARSPVVADYRHSLCNLSRATNSIDSTIKLITLGGSLVIGHRSQGCHCFNSIDSKCNLQMSNSDYEKGFCPFAKYLHLWLQTISKGKVEMYNLAQGGMSSRGMNVLLPDLLVSNDIKKLSSSDIIIIDHTVNDNHVLSDEESLAYTKDIIYKILQLSQDGDWPTIILLSMQKNSRYQLYDSIASLIHIPHWSMVYLAFSDFALNQSSMKNYLLLLQSDWEYQGKEVHPGWFYHLYLSDLLASLINEEIRECDDNFNSKHTRSSDMMILQNYKSQLSQIQECKNTLLSYHAQSFSTQDLLDLIPISNPLNSWKLYEDRHGKPGWIDEDTEGICATHDQQYYFTNITFPLNTSLINTTASYLLQVNYMKTYFNAGGVDIFVCSKLLMKLDALWLKTISIVMTSEVVFRIDDTCLMKQKTTGIVPSIIIRHKCIKQSKSIDIPNDELMIKRDKAKFKISSIHLCEM